MKKPIFLWSGGPDGAPVLLGGTGRRNLHTVCLRAKTGPGDGCSLLRRLDLDPRSRLRRPKTAAADRNGVTNGFCWPKAAENWAEVSE